MTTTRPSGSSTRARFENRATAGRRRSLRRVLLTVLAAALVGVLAWTLLFSPVLSVTSVRVEGVGPEESGAVLEAAGVSHGSPMALLDTADIAARVQRVAFVRESSATRVWPQSVVVSVVPRTALLAARTAGGQVRLVDEQAVVFRSVPTVPKGLPVAQVGSDLPEGTGDDGLGVAVEMLRALDDDQRAAVDDLRVSSANLVTFRMGKVKVIWGGAGESAKKVAVLRALLATNPAAIDVSAPDLPVTT